MTNGPDTPVGGADTSVGGADTPAGAIEAAAAAKTQPKPTEVPPSAWKRWLNEIGKGFIWMVGTVITALTGVWLVPETLDHLGLYDHLLDNPRKICTAGGYIDNRKAGDLHLSVVVFGSWTYADCRKWVRENTNATNMRLDCLVNRQLYAGDSINKDYFNAQNLNDLISSKVKCGWETLPVNQL